MWLGPFDLTGGPFLILYIVLLIATIAASLSIQNRLRPDGRWSGRHLDPAMLAYLAGGRQRFTDSAVAAMLAAGSLRIERRKHLIVNRARLATGLERGLQGLPDPASIADVERALAPAADLADKALVRSGLLVDNAETGAMRLWQTVPYLLLLGFGAIKWEIGTLRDRPVGFLTALLIVTAVLALFRAIRVDRRTRSGLDLLDRERDRWDRLRRAAVSDETSLAVALFGTMVLSGSAYADYHTLRSASSGGGDSGGGGCGGGGGGCGGCGG